ncbi:MAG: hypothetical protein RBT63_11220 [Bdellovibrionales bacterium]|nr:hypothetical protein [Bdellovibrionales bacterium]
MAIRFEALILSVACGLLIGSVTTLMPIPRAAAHTVQTQSAIFSQPEALAKLREWRGRLSESGNRAASEQKKLVTELSRVSLKHQLNTPNNASSSILDPLSQTVQFPLSEIERLDSERAESDARRRIVDQLIFVIDTKWSGQDAQSLFAFLQNQLLELALTDLSEPGQGYWWKFLIQASIALRESAEPGADPIRFLEVYMSESGVIDPKPVLEVIQSQSYVGG